MSDFKPSYTGVGRMLRSTWMLAEMERRGNNILNVAINTAPVGVPPVDEHPGRYKSSFHLTINSHGGIHHDRAEAKVTNTAPEAIYVEYGSEGAEPYHTLLIAMLTGGAM